MRRFQQAISVVLVMLFCVLTIAPSVGIAAPETSEPVIHDEANSIEVRAITDVQSDPLPFNESLLGSVATTATITFNARGGKAVASRVVNVGAAIGSLPAATRTGYTLKGWFISTSGGTAIAATQRIAGDLTLYAQWTPKKYTIKYMSFDGKTQLKKVSVNYNSTLNTGSYAPKRVGKNFVGWYTEKTGGNGGKLVSVVKGNQTVYARYKTKVYTVKYYDGNKLLATVKAKHGSAMMSAPKKANKQFVGWYTAKTGGSKVTKVTANRTLYTRYKSLPKIYLAPSDQPYNLYTGYNTNELIECNKIAEFTRQALVKNGYIVKKAPAYTPHPDMIAASNTWGAGVYVAIHTNAGGAQGAEVIAHSSKLKNTYVTSVYKQVAAINPRGGRGIYARDGLKQTTQTKAICVLIEAEFHDNYVGATWILNNHKRIGEAIAKGICKADGKAYKPL